VPLFRRSVGLAVGPDRVVVVAARRELRGWSLAHHGEGPAAAVATVLQEVPGAAATVCAALALPLASTKLVGVPSLGRRDLGLLVQRNARRFFLVGDRPLVADAARVGRAGRDGVATALAVCAEDAAVAAVESATATAGGRLEYVTAAPVAAAEGVRALVPGAGRRRLVVMLCAGAWCDLAVLDGGALTALEPCRAPAAAAERAALATRIAELTNGAAAAPARAAAVIVASPDTAHELRAAIAAVAPHLRIIGLPDWAAADPYALAAFGATLPREDAPHLLRASARVVWARRMRRRSAALAAAGILLFAAAAGVHLRGLAREAAALVQQRGRVGGGLAEARARARQVETWRTQVGTLARVEGERIEWARVLADLANALPPAAHVVTLHGQSDRIQLSGVAASAAATVPALEAAAAFRDVRLLSAVRTGGAGGPERFEIEMRLAQRVTAREGGSP